MHFRELKEQAFEANRALYASGLVHFTFGNVSAADQQAGLFAIKPSGVPYAELSPEKIVLVSFEGQTVSSTLRPSSDTPTHAALYRNWPALGGICHTHSLYATTWAQARLPIPLTGTTHADFLPVDVPCAGVLSDEQVNGYYEAETGLEIVRSFQALRYEPMQVPMVLLPGHGPFTWGTTAQEAVYHSQVLELIAQLAWQASLLRPAVKRLKPVLINKHFNRKHGPGAYYGQKDKR